MPGRTGLKLFFGASAALIAFLLIAAVSPRQASGYSSIAMVTDSTPTATESKTAVVLTNQPTHTAAPATTVALTSYDDPAQIAQGKVVFFKIAHCGNCHDTKRGIPILGPSLKGIGARAATRKPGMTAVEYIRESILSPNAYVVDGFPRDTMPQTFGETLSTDDINAVIAFVLTLN